MKTSPRQSQSNAKNGGLVELSRYIANCGVTEREPPELMHQYLASSSSIASDWKHVYPLVGADLPAHLFLSSQRSGLMPLAMTKSGGRTVADTYQTRLKTADVWTCLFEGAQLGREAKDTHLYSQFHSEIAKAIGAEWSSTTMDAKLRPDQQVMLFHMIGAVNVEVLMADPVLALSRNLSQQEYAGLCRAMRTLGATFRTSAIVAGESLTEAIASDIATIIKDCRYPVLDGQNWQTIKHCGTLAAANRLSGAPASPPPSSRISAAMAGSLERMSRSSTSASAAAADNAHGPIYRHKSWNDGVEQTFIADPLWRDFKRKNGLPMFHPARESIHRYLLAGKDTDIQFLSKKEHEILIDQIMPYCDIHSAAELDEFAAFKRKHIDSDTDMPNHRVVERMLAESRDNKSSTKLTEIFVTRLLPG